jgi:hypothetical protein
MHQPGCRCFARSDRARHDLTSLMRAASCSTPPHATDRFSQMHQAAGTQLDTESWGKGRRLRRRCTKHRSAGSTTFLGCLATIAGCDHVASTFDHELNKCNCHMRFLCWPSHPIAHVSSPPKHNVLRQIYSQSHRSRGQILTPRPLTVGMNSATGVHDQPRRC